MMKMKPEVVFNREEDSDVDSDDNGLGASKDSGKSKKHCHSTWETNHQVSDSEE